MVGVGQTTGPFSPGRLHTVTLKSTACGSYSPPALFTPCAALCGLGNASAPFLPGLTGLSG